MPQLSPFRPSIRLRTCVWIGYWCLLFTATHIPVVAGVKLPKFSDKVIHFALFFTLTFLGGWRYRAVKDGSTRGIFIWAFVYIAYAGFDEWLQQFVGRTTSLADFWANLVGVVTATIACLIMRRKSGLSDHALQS